MKTGWEEFVFRLTSKCVLFIIQSVYTRNNKEESILMMKQIEEIYPKPSSPCNCMNIHRASRAVVKFYDNRIKPSGITIAQLGLLRYIEALEPVTISALAKQMRIDRTTLNRNLKPLAAAKMLAITPGEDSRTKQVALTEPGKKAIAQAGALWAEAQRLLNEYLGEADLHKFIELMAKLEALVP